MRMVERLKGNHLVVYVEILANHVAARATSRVRFGHTP